MTILYCKFMSFIFFGWFRDRLYKFMGNPLLCINSVDNYFAKINFRIKKKDENFQANTVNNNNITVNKQQSAAKMARKNARKNLIKFMYNQISNITLNIRCNASIQRK